MPIEREQLQRYFDGELESGPASELERDLAQDRGSGAELERLRRVRSAFRVAADDMASGLDSDALFARIEAQLDTAEDETQQRRQPQPEPGLPARIGDWLRGQFGHRQVWMPATGAAVMAAAAVLTFYLPERDPGGAETMLSGEHGSSALGASSQQGASLAEGAASQQGAPSAEGAWKAQGAAHGLATARRGLDSEVVSVDFGANVGTVFEVAVGEGKTTPVVWINDE